MIAEFFLRIRHLRKTTVIDLNKDLSPEEQWTAGTNIAAGFNEVYRETYGKSPTPGIASIPETENDGIRITAMIDGKRIQSKIGLSSISVNINHLSLDENSDPVAKSIWDKIRGAKITE